MPDTVRPDRGEPAYEDLIRRFERAWLAGRRPAVEDFLHEADPSDHDLLVELAHVELEFRIKAGQPARAEDYFARFPQLAAGTAAAGLIAAEYELRRRIDPELPFDEVAAKYPQYLTRLEEYRARLTAPLFDSRPGEAASVPWPSAPGYEVLGPLGSGGMGVVFKARDERLGRVVALKFLPAEYARDPDRLALFHREARTASALNHPHICTVHDLGEHDGRPFIVMELVEGRTLRELIGGSPAVVELARLVGQAARALAVAHAAGVVHRDIKPENLMVRADGYLKLLDFGLAQRLPGAVVSTGSSGGRSGLAGVAGTAAYMSPEQARGEPPGPASDVFSLGVVLYEAATGRHPFPADRPLDVLHAITTAEPVSAARLNPELPAELVELVGRMLEKDPAVRPSAAEVDAALSAPHRAATAPPPAARPRPCTVGRGGERAGLWAAFDAAAGGTGQMVCVAGEPGIGKTTLVDDFLADLAANGRSCHVARSRCSERLVEAEAYLPVMEALDDLLRGPSGGTAARYLRTLAPTWYAELAPAADPGPPGHGSNDAAPAPTQTRLKRELITFLRELSRRVPVVLFIDDLHWADVPSADLFAYLGRHCPGLRLLLVAAYRRDELLLANHPFLPALRDLQGRGICRELAPGRLDRADIAGYLGLTFPGHGFPAALIDTLHARTGGNPLFVADLVRYLRDRGVIARPDGRWALVRPVPEAASEMPESVRGLIRRAVDRLDPADRRLLATAAARGVEFDSAVLARALGDDPADAEERLQNLDGVHGLLRLVREHEFPERTVSRRYAFVHALYQEALAAELPPARRAAVSRALADAQLSLQNGQPGLAAAELALLYETGREFGRAADLFHDAARNAARVFAHREAVRLARRGLGLLHGLPDTPDRAAREFRLRMALGLQLQVTDGFAAGGVDEAYVKARELWERAPDVGPLFPLLWGLWLCHKVRSDLPQAQFLAGELLTLAEQAGDPALVLQARQAGAIIALCTGDPAATRRHAEAAARLYDPDRHHHLTYQFGQDPGVACLAFGAVALWLLGEPREAVARSRDAVRLAREGSQPSTLALALHFAAVLHQLRGDPAAVREAAAEVLAVAVEHRFAFWQAGATVLLGWVAAASGDPGGLSLLDQGIDAWQATGSRTYRAYYLTLLADARARCGKTDDAIAALDDADRAAATTGERLAEAEGHRLRGELLTGRADGAAEECLRKALATARGQHARALELRAAASLGRLLVRCGRGEEARGVVSAAAERAAGLRDTPDMSAAVDLLRAGRP